MVDTGLKGGRIWCFDGCVAILGVCFVVSFVGEWRLLDLVLFCLLSVVL